MLSDSPWVSSYEPAPGAAVRLFCFPHAGSAAAVYSSWREKLSPSIEVCPIEYAGRGGRRSERPAVRVDALVASALRGLAPFLEMPFALFGDCMGGLIAFEFARQLARQRLPAPRGVFVAGCRAPRVPPRKAPVFALPEDALIDELRSLNGTPEDILSNPEFRRVFLPVLRSDLELADTYAYRRGQPLACTIVAYGGTLDAETPPGDLGAWADETRGRCAIRLYDGDHAFLQKSEPAVLRDLLRDVLEATAMVAPEAAPQLGGSR